VLAKYWTIAIVPTAAIKDDNSKVRKSATDPKKTRRTTTVRNVEQAIIAELNAIITGVLLIRKPEKRPSAAARTIPAKPP